MKNIPIRQLGNRAQEPDVVGNFSIRNLEEVLAGKDLLHELHRHDYFFILALQKGEGVHEIDFVPYEVHDHSFFFLRPGQVHELRLKAGSTGYLLQFTREFYAPSDPASGRLLSKVSTKNLCQLNAQRVEKLFALLHYMQQEYSEQQEGYQDVIKANLGIFFIELIRHRQNQNHLSDKNTLYTQERIEEFFTLLETHSATHKQASHYADTLNVSLYQLNAICKASLGKTASELIDEHIVLEAKRYLLATSNQVNQIAYHLGYEDVSYFIRFFKKHTGLSPETFRLNFS